MSGWNHKTLATACAVWVLLCRAALNASPPDDQFAVAARQYASRRWELAAAEFQSFLERFPNHERAGEVRFYLGEALAQTRDYAAALNALQAFIKANRDHKLADRALFRIGELAHLLGNHQLAADRLTEFCQGLPSDPLCSRARIYLAEEWQRTGKYDEAERQYRKVLQETPESVEAFAARFGLADIASRNGQYPAAIGLLQFVTRQGPQDMQTAAKARLARVELTAGNYRQARALWTELAADASTGRFRHDAQLGIAESYAREDRWDDVRRALDEIAEAERDIDGWHGLSALSASARHDTAALSAELDLLMTRWPKSTWTEEALWRALLTASEDKRRDDVVRLADTYLGHSSNVRRAESARSLKLQALLGEGKWEAVVRAAGSTVQDQLARSAAQLALGDHVAALQTLDELNGLNDSSAELQRVASVLRGMALVADGQDQQGVDMLAHLAADVPQGIDSNQFFAALASAQTRLQHWDAAERVLRQWRGQTNLQVESYELAALQLADAMARQNLRERSVALYRDIVNSDNQKIAANALAGLAWSAYRADATADSAKYYERLLSEYPDHPAAATAAVVRGQALEQEQRWDEALAMYQLVLDQYASADAAPRALLLKARVERRLRHSVEAKQSIHRLISEFPDSPYVADGWYELAWVEQEQSNESAAIDAFVHVFRDHQAASAWPDAAYRLARLSIETRDFARARECLQALTENRDRAGKLWAHAWFLRGQLAGRQEGWDDCRSAMQQVLTADTTDELRDAAAYWRAEADFRQAHWDDAKREFAEMIEQGRGRENPPWWPRIYLRHAQILAHEEDWTAALGGVDAFRRAYPEYGEPQEVEYLVGRCELGRGKFTAAREAWQRAIDQSRPPRSETAAMAQWMIGESYFMQRDYDAAIRAYLRVEALYKFPTWQAAGLLQAGKCYEMKGQWPQAIRLYRQLLDTYPENPHRDEADKRLRVAQQRAADSQ